MSKEEGQNVIDKRNHKIFVKFQRPFRIRKENPMDIIGNVDYSVFMSYYINYPADGGGFE